MGVAGRGCGIDPLVDSGNAARQLRRWAFGMRVTLLPLVVITWNMVVKPTL